MTSRSRGPRLVTVAEAAAAFGLAEAEVRKLVREGRLKGELVLRPEGSSYLVALAPDLSQALANEDVGALALASSEAMLTSLHAPLWAELAASRRLAHDQFNRVFELARETGRLTSENARVEAELEELRVRDQRALRLVRRAGVVAIGAAWAIGVSFLLRRVARSR